MLKLIIANKKYSSWSLRPWIAMRVFGIEFEEELSSFDLTTMHEHFWDFSPTKKVPVLVHNGQTIWDSLAILEYLAELNPDKQMWPKDQKLRAHARSLASEMHAGFTGLRNDCPMNMGRKPGAIDLSKETLMDIKRIETIWQGCLEKYGGPFLFGDFSNADAMFAPVVNRFEIYQLSKAPAVQIYCDSIKSLPAWQEWQQAGSSEPCIYGDEEV